ncbi:MAG TPA: MarR family winged helix-turn-helix transcriptional regulator [Polyangia bacterium]|nr:MarR family winged helix-turn-helix transcriptional regulator [Polyangia bacterium]
MGSSSGPSSEHRRPPRGLALARALARWADADRAYRVAVAGRLRMGTSDVDALILLVQDEAPWTAGKIAEALRLTTGAVTGLVDRLEKAGWVQRTRHGVDRRQVWIERAPARREELDAVLAVQSAVLTAAAEELDDASLERAVELIERAAVGMGVEATAGAEEPAAAEPGGGEALTSAPIDGATRGTLRVASGVARLELRGGRIKDLFRATFHGRAPLVRVEGGDVHLKTRGFGLFGWGGGGAEIVLTSAVPWAIDVRGGMSEVNAVLSELDLERIDVHGGASKVSFQLPAPRGTVPIRIHGGTSKLAIRRPAKAAIQVVVTGGSSGLRIDRRTHEAASGATRLATDGYDAATDRYSVEIAGGASDVAVTPDDRGR